MWVNFQPSQNSTLTAYFVDLYTVTVQSEDTNKGTAEVFFGGTVAQVIAGEFVKVLAIPKPGYVFEGWYENGFLRVSGLEIYDYYPYSTCTLVAKFNPVPQYTVTVQSEDPTKGSASGGGTCYANEYVPVSATPNSEYVFDGWYLNGSKIPGAASFNYYPSATCTLTAKFNPLPPVISGATLICSGSSQTFSASSWQSGYTWSKSSNLNLSGSGSSVSVSAASGASAAGWVSVNLGGQELTRKEVWVGAPLVAAISGQLSVQCNQYYTYTAVLQDASNSNPTSYQWVLTPSGSGNVIYNGDGKTVQICFYDTNSYKIECRANNTCGQGAYYDIWVSSSYSPAPPPFISYPNPVSDVLYIEVEQPDENNTNVGQNAFTYEIRLYDGLGNLVRQTDTKGGSTTQFNVANLPNGIYYLHLYYGINKTPAIQKIVIQH